MFGKKGEIVWLPHEMAAESTEGGFVPSGLTMLGVYQQGLDGTFEKITEDLIPDLDIFQFFKGD